MAHDPYEHDPGMKELHERNLRNSASPIHVPVVQAADYEAADDEERLDETGATSDVEVDGDADLAVSAAETEAEQVEALAPDDDEPLVDNTSPAGDDEPSPVNAFGNVAPDHADEQQVDDLPVREDDPDTPNFDESDGSFHVPNRDEGDDA